MGDIELTSAELDELERLAKAATPGPWRDADDPNADEGGERYIEVDYDGGPKTASVAYDMRNNDRAYIVAAQPAVILHLISLARSGLEARKAEESMRERAGDVVDTWSLPADSVDVAVRCAEEFKALASAIRVLPLTEGGDKP